MDKDVNNRERFKQAFDLRKFDTNHYYLPRAKDIEDASGPAHLLSEHLAGKLAAHFDKGTVIERTYADGTFRVNGTYYALVSGGHNFRGDAQQFLLEAKSHAHLRATIADRTGSVAAKLMNFLRDPQVAVAGVARREIGKLQLEEMVLKRQILLDITHHERRHEAVKRTLYKAVPLLVLGGLAAVAGPAVVSAIVANGVAAAVTGVAASQITLGGIVVGFGLAVRKGVNREAVSGVGDMDVFETPDGGVSSGPVHPGAMKEVQDATRNVQALDYGHRRDLRPVRARDRGAVLEAGPQPKATQEPTAEAEVNDLDQAPMRRR
jgi:hypothetical protein